jgi:hypothetical protein
VPWTQTVGRDEKRRIPEDIPIYGKYSLPDGYELAYVPRYADVKPLDPKSVKKVVKLDRNITGIIIAIFQTLYALFTLYRASIEQVSTYGYASFGLTVAPYATMSIVNLFASLICPSRQMLYLIETSVMQEARSRPGAVFNEVVGRVEDDDEVELLFTGRNPIGTYIHRGALTAEFANGSSFDIILRGGDDDTQNGQDKGSTVSENEIAGSQSAREKPSYQPLDAIAAIPSYLPPKSTRKTSHNRRFWVKCGGYRRTVVLKRKTQWTLKAVYYLLTVIMTVTPVTIVGAISHFRPASSTIPQRVWLMSWLCWGLSFSWITEAWAALRPLLVRRIGKQLSDPLFFPFVLGASVSAVGGYVVVGQMLSSYGSCTRIY